MALLIRVSGGNLNNWPFIQSAIPRAKSGMRRDQFTTDAPGRIVTTATSEGDSPAFIPNRLPPELDDGSLLNSLADAAQALGRLHGIGPRVGSNRVLIEPFARKEALESSKIEGTQATLSDIYAYEAGEERLIRGDNREGAREVLNYLDALRYGLEAVDAGEDISIELICEMHRRLLTGVRGERANPGEIRTEQNWIGPPDVRRARYVPPPPEEVPELLEQLVDYVNRTNGTHPLVRTGLVHYQFETIHPFLDGNGRMGRLLISLLLQKAQLLPEPYLYLSSYFNHRKREYADSMLDVSQAGEWESWLQFFLEGVRTQANEAHRRADVIVDLRETYQERYRAERSGNILELVMKLFEQPYLDVEMAREWLDVSHDTANRLVNRLEDDGVLEELTGKQRNRFFRAREVFDVISKPISQLD